MPITYRMYLTRDPKVAARAYEERTGQVPTMILARPEAELKGDHPLLIRNRTSPFGALLVTHEGTVPDFGETGSLPAHAWIPTLVPDRERPKTRGRGRPKSECRCPMCDAPVLDFNRLGFWWGWQYGIRPPYWDGLVDYILSRDGYRCLSCHKQVTSMTATVHHILPKEDGGPDSARNLQTLCQGCHTDAKPIMDEQ